MVYRKPRINERSIDRHSETVARGAVIGVEGAEILRVTREFQALWKWEKRIILSLSLCLLFVGVTLAALSAMPARGQLVEAGGFVLRDDQGILRARLFLNDEDLPSLTFFDSLGREQFALRCTEGRQINMEFYEDGLKTARIQPTQHHDQPLLGEGSPSERLIDSLRGDDDQLTSRLRPSFIGFERSDP